ncbi:melanoma antigen recognized by T-cells 1 isoform X1 [Alligator mississippiensis]|uniref:melanoma antigen recognized by T-cells 1 isoform X1 n=1 Tax=Alligator mississippiensis TaxID=8496 RepID=UPI002877A0E1|nr:melanoma antigen recognized by T-cells 1 isoform X1 [Alligator mississippiensis]
MQQAPPAPAHSTVWGQRLRYFLVSLISRDPGFLFPMEKWRKPCILPFTRGKCRFLTGAAHGFHSFAMCSLQAGTVPACRELGGSRRRAVRQGAPCACTRTRPRQPGEQLPQNKSSGVITLRTSASGHALLDSKGPLQQYSNFNSVVPDAPPAYDKISAEPLPPPYSL